MQQSLWPSRFLDQGDPFPQKGHHYSGGPQNGGLRLAYLEYLRGWHPPVATQLRIPPPSSSGLCKRQRRPSGPAPTSSAPRRGCGFWLRLGSLLRASKGRGKGHHPWGKQKDSAHFVGSKGRNIKSKLRGDGKYCWRPAVCGLDWPNEKEGRQPPNNQSKSYGVLLSCSS